MIILIGAMSGLIGAEKAGVLTTVLFVVGGLLVGIGMGMASGSLAYSVLSSKRLPAAVALVVYQVIPMFFMVGTPFLALWLAWVVKPHL